MISCSFCGLPSQSVGALLAGPDVNICDQCIDVGVRTIETRDALEDPGLKPEDWAVIEDETLLHQAAATSALVDKTRDRLQLEIRELRRRGINWSAIGVALGLSCQTAQERFG
ncbi:MAG: ClpX C4-type zinc finger protein [Pseudomonadota bacterium]